MANWHRVFIEFHTPLTDEQLEKMGKGLKIIDYDAPIKHLTHSGLEADWRSPMYDIKLVTGLLHFAGFPCKWDQRLTSPYFDSELIEPHWEESSPLATFGIGQHVNEIGLMVAAEFLQLFGEYTFVPSVKQPK